MRSAVAIDLDAIDLAACPRPDHGESLIREAKTQGLALRLRASGAQTWVMFEKAGRKTTHRTLGDASLLPLDTARRMASAQPHGADPVSDMRALVPSHSAEARISDVMPHFLASSENGR